MFLETSFEKDALMLSLSGRRVNPVKEARLNNVTDPKSLTRQDKKNFGPVSPMRTKEDLPMEEEQNIEEIGDETLDLE